MTVAYRCKKCNSIVVAKAYPISMWMACDCPIRQPFSSARAALSGDYIPCKLDVVSMSMLAWLHRLHEQRLGNTAGSVKLFRASTLRASINIAASYPLVVTDYRSSGRYRAIALLAPSLLETYHSSLLYARRHICSNPLELLQTHLCIHRYWTPCVCSLTWASLASITKSPRSRLFCVM